jgi:plastocyanin
LTDLFNRGLLAPSASFTFVVPTSGTYGYECILHVSSGMAGSISAG